MERWGTAQVRSMELELTSPFDRYLTVPQGSELLQITVDDMKVWAHVLCPTFKGVDPRTGEQEGDDVFRYLVVGGATVEYSKLTGLKYVCSVDAQVRSQYAAYVPIWLHIWVDSRMRYRPAFIT